MSEYKARTEMPKILVGDIQLNYETYGQGEPLVLIPGFRTGLWLWFKQVEAFARKSERFNSAVIDFIDESRS